MDSSPHSTHYVEVNGIHLHYLDWGGLGEPMLFLAGLGCNAHIFDRFATRFTDKFHVLALTRRGHGESDHPDAGYDIDTLTGDIDLFLDRLGIRRVILAGHSLAGLELTHFAALHPDKVISLVYLDSAYNYLDEACREMEAAYPLDVKPPLMKDAYYSPEEYFADFKRIYPSMAVVWDEAMETQGRLEIMQDTNGRVIDRLTDEINGAIVRMTHAYSPEFDKIKAPALAIFTIDNGVYYTCAEWMPESQRASAASFYKHAHARWVRSNMAAFRRAVPHARILEIPAGHHYVFIKSEQIVFEEMRRFLLS